MARSRPLIVPDVRYVPVSNRNQLLQRLKYFQYRKGSLRRDQLRADPDRHWSRVVVSDSDPAMKREDTRWVDIGMGEHYGRILQEAEASQGRKVLAWTYVMSPDPLLLVRIPKDRQAALVAQLSERVMDEYFEERGWGPARFSYVIHDRQTMADGREAPHIHAHIVAPASYYDIEAGATRDCTLFPEHIRQLHTLASHALIRELERELGVDPTRQILLERGHDEHHPLVMGLASASKAASGSASGQAPLREFEGDIEDDFSDWFPSRQT